MYIVNQHKSATLDGISTKILTDSGPSIKLLIGGLIRDAPDPPNPPYESFYRGSRIFYNFGADTIKSGRFVLILDIHCNWTNFINASSGSALSSSNYK